MDLANSGGPKSDKKSTVWVIFFGKNQKNIIFCPENDFWQQQKMYWILTEKKSTPFLALCIFSQNRGKSRKIEENQRKTMIIEWKVRAPDRSAGGYGKWKVESGKCSFKLSRLFEKVSKILSNYRDFSPRFPLSTFHFPPDGFDFLAGRIRNFFLADASGARGKGNVLRREIQQALAAQSPICCGVAVISGQ